VAVSELETLLKSPQEVAELMRDPKRVKELLKNHRALEALFKQEGTRETLLMAAPTIGALVKIARFPQSQSALSQASGASPATIACIETDTLLPGDATIGRIAMALGLSETVTRRFRQLKGDAGAERDKRRLKQIAGQQGLRLDDATPGVSELRPLYDAIDAMVGENPQLIQAAKFWLNLTINNLNSNSGIPPSFIPSS